MSNEIDTLAAGELQPYSGDVRPFAPELGNSWGRTDLDEYQQAPQNRGPAFFGTALPTGTTQQQADAMLGQLGAAFMNDFAQLGYPSNYVQATISFMQANANKKPYQVTPRHNLRLPKEADDWLGHAFANAISEQSGSPRAKQQFVTAAITWLAKVTAKLKSQTEGSVTLPRTAPNSSQAALSQLSDSDYSKVVAINDKAQLQTLNTLSAKHGQYTAQNMIALAQAHLEKLTPAERAHFDQFTTGWVHMMNCVETIEFLYSASIGRASMPQDGASIAKELAEFDRMLRVPSERARYMKDPQLQARYRTLLDMRGS
ncbi:hypothetical protein [Pseudomonas fluorescens group sp. PF-69]